MSNDWVVNLRLRQAFLRDRLAYLGMRMSRHEQTLILLSEHNMFQDKSKYPNHIQSLSGQPPHGGTAKGRHRLGCSKAIQHVVAAPSLPIRDIATQLVQVVFCTEPPGSTKCHVVSTCLYPHYFIYIYYYIFIYIYIILYIFIIFYYYIFNIFQYYSIIFIVVHLYSAG
jgi:hypothetical protein